MTLGSENRLHITCCKRTWCSSVSEEEVVFQVELHFIKCQKIPLEYNVVVQPQHHKIYNYVCMLYVYWLL